MHSLAATGAPKAQQSERFVQGLMQATMRRVERVRNMSRASNPRTQVRGRDFKVRTSIKRLTNRAIGTLTNTITFRTNAKATELRRQTKCLQQALLPKKPLTRHQTPRTQLHSSTSTLPVTICPAQSTMSDSVSVRRARCRATFICRTQLWIMASVARQAHLAPQPKLMHSTGLLLMILLFPRRWGPVHLGHKVIHGTRVVLRLQPM